MEALSQQQQKAYDYIRKHIKEMGYAPSTREICNELDYKSSSTAHNLLLILERKGYIKRNPGAIRAITIVEENQRPEKLQTFMCVVMKEARRNSLMELMEENDISEAEYYEIDRWFREQWNIKLWWPDARE